MKSYSILLTIAVLLLLNNACRKFEVSNSTINTTEIDQLKIPEGFDYNTLRTLDLFLQMPQTVDFTTYKSRFLMYSDSLENSGTLLASGTFNEKGIYQGKLTIPTYINQLYFKSKFSDSIIPIQSATKFINIDLKNLYSNVNIDTILNTATAKSVEIINNFNQAAVVGNSLVNGDFSENDFSIAEHFGAFFPNLAKWSFAIRGIGNTPLTWYNESGNGYIGTTDEGTHQYGVVQTIAVSPGDLITFNANVKAVNANGMHSFYRLLPAKSGGGLLGNATLQYSYPAYEWTTKTVAMTMPKDAAYCIVEVLGGDWTPNGRILFDNLSVNGVTDKDGDGVEDELDDYPTNTEKAYNYFFPNENDYGTLAFEDTWPGKGDYDFNDMVVDYQYNQILNADNKMVQLDLTFRFRAAGAGVDNGFGFQMEVSPSKIASVSGTVLNENIVNISSNGTENGQDKATIIVTDNVFKVLKHPGGGVGVNTSPDAPYVDPVSLNLSIKFTSPISLSEAGYAPYNPFIFINRTRGREVHLPGYEPTNLVDTKYFGTQDDDTNLAQSKYYLTDHNLPWGINLPLSFDYPVEGEQILSAYNHFARWAQSRGYTFMDWYKNNPGYTNEKKVFRKR